MNKKYTIENTFHNTVVSFLAPAYHDNAFEAYSELNYDEFYIDKDSEEYKKAHRKLLRIKKVLCGMKDCQCGGSIR